MSLRINTNVPAMTAMRYLSQTDAMMSGSVTRLATGLRINTAADDPAGLIISEGLRSQIKGIEQASRNVQDAVNMARTAEGAMDEISRLLRDVRGLAVHSANTATIDAAQLEANQTQVRSVVDSIRRIAEQTTWGSKRLLNGSSGVSTSVTRTDLVSSAFVGSTFNGATVRTGSITIDQTTAATRTTTGALATTFASTGATVGAGTFVLNGQAFTVQAGMTVNDVLAMVNQQSATTGVSATVAGTPLQFTLTSTKFGSRYPINYLETGTILNNGSGATPAVGANAVYDVTVPVEPSGTQTETFTGGVGPNDDGLTLTSPSGNKLVVTVAGNAVGAATVVGQLNVGSMRFQIGSNSDQATTFSIPSVDPSRLGTAAVAGQNLSTIDLRSPQGARDAMAIIDDAISQLSALRGNLGSFQKNFLESTGRSLAVAQENITASESQIRDADLAKEMTEFTKVQILRQSGVSVLAQANQAPQSVLQLLRGG